MPRIDGFQFCRELRKHRFGAKVPLIITSAIYKDVATQLRLKKEVGDHQFFAKPYEMRDLVEAVRRIFDGGNRRKEHAPPPPPPVSPPPPPAIAFEAAAAPSEKGTLADTSLPRLLLDLASRRASGTLTRARQGQEVAGPGQRRAHQLRVQPAHRDARPLPGLARNPRREPTSRGAHARPGAKRAAGPGAGRAGLDQRKRSLAAARRADARQDLQHSPLARRHLELHARRAADRARLQNAHRRRQAGLHRLAKNRARRRDRAAARHRARPRRAHAARRAPPRDLRPRVRSARPGGAGQSTAHRRPDGRHRSDGHAGSARRAAPVRAGRPGAGRGGAARPRGADRSGGARTHRLAGRARAAAAQQPLRRPSRRGAVGGEAQFRSRPTPRRCASRSSPKYLALLSKGATTIRCWAFRPMPSFEQITTAYAAQLDRFRPGALCRRRAGRRLRAHRASSCTRRSRAPSRPSARPRLRAEYDRNLAAQRRVRSRAHRRRAAGQAGRRALAQRRRRARARQAGGGGGSRSRRGELPRAPGLGVVPGGGRAAPHAGAEGALNDAWPSAGAGAGARPRRHAEAHEFAGRIAARRRGRRPRRPPSGPRARRPAHARRGAGRARSRAARAKASGGCSSAAIGPSSTGWATGAIRCARLAVGASWQSCTPRGSTIPSRRAWRRSAGQAARSAAALRRLRR